MLRMSPIAWHLSSCARILCSASPAFGARERMTTRRWMFPNNFSHPPSKKNMRIWSIVCPKGVPSGTGPSTTAGSRCGSLMPSVYSSLPEGQIKKLYMKEVVTLNVVSAALGTCDWKAMRPGAIVVAGAGSTPRSHFLASVMLEARSPGEMAGKGGGTADSCRYLYHYRRSGLVLLISLSETCRLCAISAALSSSPSRRDRVTRV